MHVVGTCSICGGRVCTEEMWMGSPETFPPPKCINCGAKPKRAFGRVIDMEASKVEIEKNPSPYTHQTTGDLGNYRIRQG